MAPFQHALVSSTAMQGVRDHCIYDGVFRPEDSEATVVVMNLRTAAGGFAIDGAWIRHAGILDEYQQQCVLDWLKGAQLHVPDVEPGRRYRVTYPMKLGATKPGRP